MKILPVKRLDSISRVGRYFRHGCSGLTDLRSSKHDINNSCCHVYAHLHHHNTTWSLKRIQVSLHVNSNDVCLDRLETNFHVNVRYYAKLSLKIRFYSLEEQREFSFWLKQWAFWTFVKIGPNFRFTRRKAPKSCEKHWNSFAFFLHSTVEIFGSTDCSKTSWKL